MRSLKLTETNPPKGARAEQVLLLVSHGGEDDSWGELEPLRGTSWEKGVKVITAEALSNALHGHIRDLLSQVGWDTRSRARRVIDEEGLCALRDTCISWDEGYCRPGGRDGRTQGPPSCYEPPLESGTDLKTVQLFREVAMAWKEGRHVVVTRGKEFSLR